MPLARNNKLTIRSALSTPSRSIVISLLPLGTCSPRILFYFQLYPSDNVTTINNYAKLRESRSIKRRSSRNNNRNRIERVAVDSFDGNSEREKERRSSR